MGKRPKKRARILVVEEEGPTPVRAAATAASGAPPPGAAAESKPRARRRRRAHAPSPAPPPAPTAADGALDGSAGSSDDSEDSDMGLFMATALGGGSSGSSSEDEGTGAYGSGGGRPAHEQAVGSMPVAEAQRTKVVRVRGVFSGEDIAELLAFHKRRKQRCGSDAKKHGDGAMNWFDGHPQLAFDETVILTTPPCLSRLKHLVKIQRGAIKCQSRQGLPTALGA